MENHLDAAASYDVPAGAWPAAPGIIARHTETRSGGFSLTCDSEELTWKELAHENRRFIFNRQIAVRVIREEGGWTYESDEIELMGFGHSRGEAESSFCFGFVAQWDDLACEEDEKLTQDAIDMKRTLLALVKTEE